MYFVVKANEKLLCVIVLLLFLTIAEHTHVHINDDGVIDHILNNLLNGDARGVGRAPALSRELQSCHQCLRNGQAGTRSVELVAGVLFGGAQCDQVQCCHQCLQTSQDGICSHELDAGHGVGYSAAISVCGKGLAAVSSGPFELDAGHQVRYYAAIRASEGCGQVVAVNILNLMPMSPTPDMWVAPML